MTKSNTAIKIVGEKGNELRDSRLFPALSSFGPFWLDVCWISHFMDDAKQLWVIELSENTKRPKLGGTSVSQNSFTVWLLTSLNIFNKIIIIYISAICG